MYFCVSVLQFSMKTDGQWFPMYSCFYWIKIFYCRGWSKDFEKGHLRLFFSYFARNLQKFSNKRMVSTFRTPWICHCILKMASSSMQILFKSIKANCWRFIFGWNQLVFVLCCNTKQGHRNAGLLSDKTFKVLSCNFIKFILKVVTRSRKKFAVGLFIEELLPFEFRKSHLFSFLQHY